MLKLSNRLQAIADLVTSGARMADIGSDHALLPVYLVQLGKSPSAVAGELNAGPLQAARRQVAAAGLAERVAVRQGDGLAVLAPGEADTVTIAGMGGSLMRDILETGLSEGKLEGVKELVLQPNVGEELVRDWLRSRGWFLAGERILEEDGKIYEILRAVKEERADELNEELYSGLPLRLSRSEPSSEELLLKMGPYLLRTPGETFVRKWRSELAKRQRIAEQLSRSDMAEAGARQEQLRKEMAAIEEVLECLQTDKPLFN